MIAGTVVIVTHNSAACIERCLQALAPAENWRIVVVDNASADATLAKAQQAAPNICVVRNGENRGFAGAVNQGIKIAEGDTIVILNADAIPVGDALDQLRRRLADDGVGAAGGSLHSSDGNVEKGFTVRRFPTLGSALSEVLLLNRVWPNNPWNRRYLCLDLDYSRLQHVEQPAGACLAIRRQAWEDVGGFDQGFYPVWFEDVDFCRRLRKAGWRIVYCPDAMFEHAGGHSVSQLSFADRQSFWYRNLLHYFAKHHSRFELQILRWSIVAGLVIRGALAAVGLRAPGVSLREAAAAYKRAAWEEAITGWEAAGRRKEKSSPG